MGVILHDGLIKPAVFEAIRAEGLRCCLNICVGEEIQSLRELPPLTAWRNAFMHRSLVATVRMD